MLQNISHRFANKTVWPSGLRRWLQAPVRKGVGSNPTAVIFEFCLTQKFGTNCLSIHNRAFRMESEVGRPKFTNMRAEWRSG